jgi:2-polyprenyl-3-methyl-5-hydroxy-6-metoxy-1,4-benzoquinol methylase
MAGLTTQGGEECAVCEAAPAEPRIRLDDYHLFYCAACGSWSSDAGYRGVFPSFEPTRYFDHTGVDRERWGDLLERRENSRRPLDSVLDVGCGNGSFLAFVRGRARSTRRFGIEIDPDRVSEARSGDPEAMIYEGDAHATLDDIGGQFDLITLWDVFEHVPAPGRLLAALASRLAPGGWIYIQTIHENSLVPFAGRAVHRASGGRVARRSRFLPRTRPNRRSRKRLIGKRAAS